MSLDIPKTIYENLESEQEICLNKSIILSNNNKIKTNKKNKILKTKNSNKKIKLTKNQENDSSDKSKNSSKEEDLITLDSFNNKEKDYYKILHRFYGTCSDEELKTIYNILAEKGISLRKFEWFVMRYGFYYKTVFHVKNRFMDDRVYVHKSYKGHQKTYSKEYFDPFKRKNSKSKETRKFLFDLSEYGKDFSIVTSIPQLHFARWILTFGIIDYVKENYDEIFKKENENEVNKFFDEKSERSKKSKNTKNNDNSTTDSSKSQNITVNRGVVFAF